MEEKLIVGLIGVVTGFLGALLKSWLDSRLKLDEETRKERWEVYKKLWTLTKCVPKWPREESLTYGTLLKFSTDCRDWYFTEGGFHLSTPARKAYGRMQDALGAAQMLTALNAVPVPLIGRVHGAALGGGCGLAAVCDIVVAAEDTVFGFTETKLGILPAVISPFALAKIGRSAARELFLTGMRFSAARAKEIGLAHAVVPASDLDAAVDGYIGELLGAGPQAIAAAKALIPEVWPRTAADAAAITSAAIAKRRVSPEGQEGLRAFLDRRKPNWIADKDEGPR